MLDSDEQLEISAHRCAEVSTFTHLGQEKQAADLDGKS